MIFAKSYCPYCKRTKMTFDKVLKELGFDEDTLTYDVVELDQLPGGDGVLIQDHLYDLTDQRTVPNIFIAGMHIGGNSDIEDLLYDGELHTLLAEAV
jgi:glutaredoxin 3